MWHKYILLLLINGLLKYITYIFTFSLNFLFCISFLIYTFSHLFIDSCNISVSISVSLFVNLFLLLSSQRSAEGVDGGSGWSEWVEAPEPTEVGCWSFVGQSLHRALSLLRIRGLQERRTTKNTINTAGKALRWLWIKRGDICCSALLGHKSGTDHPWVVWVAQVRVSEDQRPKILCDPGFITEVVSKLHHMGFEKPASLCR